MMLKPILLGTAVLLSGLSPATAQVTQTDLAEAQQTVELPPSSYGALIVTSGMTPDLRAGTQYRQVATTPRRMPTQAMLAASAPNGGPVATAVTRGASFPATVAPTMQIKPIRIPRGYKAAWDDGRLNPYAGAQTLQGALQTARVWTQTVPRELKTGPTENTYILVQPSQYGRLKPYVSGERRTFAVPSTAYPFPKHLPYELIYGKRR